MGEVPLLVHVHEFSVKVPCPRMKRTTETLYAATFCAQQSSAVKAAIYIRTNLSGGCADNNDGVMNDFVDNVVAHIRNLFLATCQLPALTPDRFYFAVVPIL